MEQTWEQAAALLERLLSSGGQTVLAIDGRAAAGKTTLARALSARFSLPVVHMDDFFLPPALRDGARLAEAGGNVHYERFAAEVLPHLQSGTGFSYRRFDCGRMDYGGTAEIPPAPGVIVEGAYSRHPAFGDYCTAAVFMSVPPEEQARRILDRNGPALLRMFRERWIPMEERYIAAFGIAEKCDLCLVSEAKGER